MAFVECLFKHDNWNMPEKSAPECAQKTDIDWHYLKQCSNSTHGKTLLWQSAIKLLNLKPHNIYVPWILIDNRHSSEKDKKAFENLMELVCDTYKGYKHGICNETVIDSVSPTHFGFTRRNPSLPALVKDNKLVQTLTTVSSIIMTTVPNSITKEINVTKRGYETTVAKWNYLTTTALPISVTTVLAPNSKNTIIPSEKKDKILVINRNPFKNQSLFQSTTSIPLTTSKWYTKGQIIESIDSMTTTMKTIISSPTKLGSEYDRQITNSYLSIHSTLRANIGQAEANKELSSLMTTPTSSPISQIGQEQYIASRYSTISWVGDTSITSILDSNNAKFNRTEYNLAKKEIEITSEHSLQNTRESVIYAQTDKRQINANGQVHDAVDKYIDEQQFHKNEDEQDEATEQNIVDQLVDILSNNTGSIIKTNEEGRKIVPGKLMEQINRIKDRIKANRLNRAKMIKDVVGLSGNTSFSNVSSAIDILGVALAKNNEQLIVNTTTTEHPLSRTSTGAGAGTGAPNDKQKISEINETKPTEKQKSDSTPVPILDLNTSANIKLHEDQSQVLSSTEFSRVHGKSTTQIALNEFEEDEAPINFDDKKIVSKTDLNSTQISRLSTRLSPQIDHVTTQGSANIPLVSTSGPTILNINDNNLYE